MWLDALPVQLYAVYDYWHTGPNYFLARVAILLALTLVGYAWCRWGAGQWGFSPLIQMGQTSLLVYWVHIEFVYGRFSILEKGAQTIPAASVGLLVIFVAMVLLSMARTRWKGQGAEVVCVAAGSDPREASPAKLIDQTRFADGTLGLLRQTGSRGLVGVAVDAGPRRDLENVFAGLGQAHFLAGDALDRCRVGLERLHAVLQLAIFFVDLVDFLLNLRRFLLRPAHGDQAVRAEDILKQEQSKRAAQEPAQISAQKLAQVARRSFTAWLFY